MTHYTIHYNGNASRFKSKQFETFANSEREAVETIYSQIMPENYFPKEDGFIYDSTGHVIAAPDSDVISYDAGNFYALVTDLLKTPELIPCTIKEILEDYNEAESYSELSELQQRLEHAGYTIDWGLDTVPHNLRPNQLAP